MQPIVTLSLEKTDAPPLATITDTKEKSATIPTTEELDSYQSKNIKSDSTASLHSTLSLTANKTTLDKSDENDKVTLTISLLLPSGVVTDEGVLTLDLSNTNLTLLSGDYPTVIYQTNNVVYNNVTKKLVIRWKNGLDGLNTSFNINVRLNGSAKKDETYQPTLSFEAKEGGVAGSISVNPEDITPITVIQSSENSGYPEATSKDVLIENHWTGFEGRPIWNNNSGYANGISRINQYCISSGEPVHFSELKIKKVFHDESFNWSYAVPTELKDVEFSALAEGKRVGEIKEYIPNQSLTMTFGDLNCTKINLYDPVIVPKGTAPGEYKTSYEIYNGDTLVYTTTRKTIVYEDASFVNFNHTINKLTIRANDILELTTNLGVASGGEGVKNLTFVYDIPSGLAPIQLSDYNPLNTVEYLLEGEQKYRNLTFSDRRQADFTAIENAERITKIRVKYAPTLYYLSNQAQLYVKNVSAKKDTKLLFGVQSITYNDFEGNTHEYYDDQPSKKKIFEIAVQDTDKEEVVPSLITNVASANFHGIPMPDSAKNQGNIFIGSSYDMAYSLALPPGTKGSIKNPYLFIKVPKGVKVKSLKEGAAQVISELNGNSLVSNDISNIYPTEFATCTLEDGSTLASLKISGELDFTSVGNYYTALYGAFKLSFNTILSGAYTIEFGAGSLSQANYDTSKVFAGSNTTATLSAEVADALGANERRYVSYIQNINVENSTTVLSKQDVKGSEDAEWISGTTGTGVSIPGKEVDFRYTLQNSGSSALKNLEIINMFPYEGDTRITTGEPKGSQNTILATDKVNVIVNGENIPVSRFYTTSKTPERFDKVGNDIAGDGWLPVASGGTIPSDAKGIKIVLSEDFNPGDIVEFSFTGLLPGDAARNGEVAYNTLAYRGVKSDQSYLAQELGLTSVRATTPANDGLIEGIVFSDRNKDGSLNEEPGLNGVLIELYKKNNEGSFDYVASTTSNSDTANEKQGLFFFSDLEFGVYKLRVTLPENSDFITTGTARILPDQTDPQHHGWLQLNGKAEFRITDVGGALPEVRNIGAAIYSYVTLDGMIMFQDKEGTNRPSGSQLAKGWQVQLKDKKEQIIAETSIDKNGSYSFRKLDLQEQGTYTLTMLPKANNHLAFTSANPNGQLTLTYEKQTGLLHGTTWFYITDTIAPIIDIKIKDDQLYNPTDMTITVQDDSTTTISWWLTASDQSETKLYGPFTNNGENLPTVLGYLARDHSNGSYALHATATDLAGNQTTSEQEFFLLTEPPTITAGTTEPVDFELGCNHSWTKADFIEKYNITAVDAIGRPIDVNQITIDDSTLDYTTLGRQEVNVYATDAIGNTSEKKVLLVNVVDTTPPELKSKEHIEYSIHTNVDEAKFLADMNIETRDNSSSDVSVSSDFGTAVHLDQSGTYTVTITAEDGSKNAVSKQVSVKVTKPLPTIHVEKKQLVCQVNQIVTEEQFLRSIGASIVDEEFDDLVVHSNLTAVITDWNQPGQYQVILSGQDPKGNQAKPIKITVIIKNTIPPTLANITDKQVEATTELLTLGNIFGETTVDYYQRTVPITYELQSDKRIATVFTSDVVGDYLVKATAVDEDGNIATKILKLSITDTTAPELTIGNQIRTIQLNTQAPNWVDFFGVLATDIADKTIQTKINVDASNVNLFKLGSYPVVFSVKDANGNAPENVVGTVTVVNTAIPVITGDTIYTLKVQPKGTRYSENEWIKRLGLSASSQAYQTISVHLNGIETVDVSEVGHYQLTATSVDADGNKAAPLAIRITITEAEDPASTTTSASKGKSKPVSTTSSDSIMPQTGTKIRSLFYVFGVGIIVFVLFVLYKKNKQTK